MPRYQISDSQTGRTLTIEGDAPPTEQDATELFASLPAPKLTGAETAAALKPFPKPNLGLPFAEVQPNGEVIQRRPGNDPERNQEELAKVFQSVLPQTSDADRMRANLQQMSLAENVSPTPKAEIAETLAHPSAPPDPIVTGVGLGIKDLVSGFTSPIGIATLGMGALPRATQKLVSLAFAAQMIKQAPDIASQLGTEFGKPEEERDAQKIAKLITEGAGTVGFTAMAAKHGLAPEVKPQLQGPPTIGSMLKTPEGAKPLATIGDALEAKGTPLKSPKSETEELAALRKKDLTDDGLTKDEEKRFFELSRNETALKRAAKTKNHASLLKEAGVTVPDDFLHPSEGVENHITGWTRDKNGFIQVRIETHTPSSSSAKLITVKSGDTLLYGMNDTIEGTTRYKESNPDPAKPSTAPHSKPVAASEAPKPVPAPPVEESAPKVAPVTFKGIQKGAKGIPDMEYYDLTEDIPGHRKGSTMGRKQLESLGYTIPEGLNKGVAQPSTAQPHSQSSETPALVSSEAAPTGQVEATGQKTTPNEEKNQVGKEPKGKMTIKVHNPYGLASESEKILTITGKPVTVPEFPEGKFVAYGKQGYWRVVEKTTGLGVAKGRTLKEALSDASQKISAVGMSHMREIIAQAEKLNPETVVVNEPALSRGPGAATAGEPGTYSPIQRMADELRTTAGEAKPIDDQLSAISKLKATGADVKDSLSRTAAKTKAVADALWQKWKGLPEYRDEQRAVGKWFRALQQADHEARNFAKEVTREVPSKLRREAITNWIQADGDVSVLQERASKSTGSIRQGYEIAGKLTPREVEIAEMLRYYYDQQLERGLGEGLIKEGLENYITQVWKKENPITKKLISELSGSKLQPNFKYARKRLFDSYFEGEQAGYVPNKDAGFLVANYDQQFNRSLAARAFIKDLHEGTASDGRPLVELSGNGKVIEQTGSRSLEQPKTVMIKPKAKPEELADYRTIDHPALRGWKWATTTPEGHNVLVEGDMLVHPEAYQKLKNRLSVSAFRQHPVTRTILDVQSGIKQTMLSVSGFHQVQETLHALGHRVNPMNLPEIDFSEPTTRALAEHGLQLADYDALSSFSEGLSGGGLLEKVPGIGPKLHAYNEWLFQDYIPRLKLEMAKHALERNRERYPTLGEDKLLEQTASQANAAFGELPYKYWGRSPTLQDALRTFILAPDFLEARARFVGRAVRPYGREQLIALGLLAATQYITARIVNQVLDKDPHWEMKNAFRIVVGSHAYGMRSIPGDMLHLFTDTRGFFYNRMSPMLRTAVEYVTGRDDRGVKKDIMEQVKDAATMPLPISMKPRAGQKWWETFLNSFGVQEQRWDAVQTIQSKVAEFKKAHNIVSPVDIVYNRDKDQYANLKTAIENSDEKSARAEVAKLEKTIPKSKIIQHFRLSYTRPLTGSHKYEKAFLDGLDEAGKEEYREAMDLRKARLDMVRSVLRAN